MNKKFFLLAISFIALMNFGFTEANSNNQKINDLQISPIREKHIDITVTSTGGCTFHVVGTVYYTIIPPRLNGFVGTVTIGGSIGCPHQTFNINYSSLNKNHDLQESKNGNEDNVDLIFNTDMICDLSTATWIASDQSTSDDLNYSGISERLIEEIREGECN